MEREQQTHSPKEKITLLMPTPAVSLFENPDILKKNVNSLRQELQESGRYYYEDNAVIVSRSEDEPDHTGTSYVTYCVFDRKTGLPNYGADYIKIDEKLRFSEATLYNYTQEPENPNISLRITSSETDYEKRPLATRYEIDPKTLRYHLLEDRSTPESVNPYIRTIKKQIYHISKNVDFTVTEDQLY